MYFGFVLAWVILFGKINRGATLKLPGVTCFSAGKRQVNGIWNEIFHKVRMSLPCRMLGLGSGH